MFLSLPGRNVLKLCLGPMNSMGVSTHRSNRAKEGLYHGKDIMFGHSVSHSMKKTKRRWYPNVQNKRVWSDILDTWVRFKMTTAAMKAIDDIGGIDNYLLSLDNRTVMDSNYVTKIRGIVANLLYHNGSLDEKIIRKLKFDKSPPEKISPEEIDLSHSKKVSRRQHMWRT